MRAASRSSKTTKEVFSGLIAYGFALVLVGSVGLSGCGDDGEVDDAQPITTGASTEDGAREGPADTSPTAAEGPPYLLGQQTGLGIVYGRTGGQPLTLLDLDSGQRIELGRAGMVPVAAAENKVLIVGTDIGPVEGPVDNYMLVDLDAPDENETEFGSREGRLSFLTMDESIWFLVSRDVEEPDTEQVSLVEYSFDGEVLADIPLPADAKSSSNSPHDAWIAAVAAGVLSRPGGAPSQPFDGTLITIGQTKALGERCDDSSGCRIGWYTQSTKGDWIELDHTVPENDLRKGFSALVGDDRWLVALATENAQASVDIYDSETGQLTWTIDPMGETFLWENRGPLAVFSPDGRWLLDNSAASGTAIVDLGSVDSEHNPGEFPVVLSTLDHDQAVFVELLR